MGLEVLGEFFFLGEVEFEHDEVLGGLVFEGVEGEDFFLEFDAPAAPVGAGEVHEDVLVVLGGGGLGVVEAGDPAFGGAGGGGEGENEGGDGGGEGAPGEGG